MKCYDYSTRKCLDHNTGEFIDPHTWINMQSMWLMNGTQEVVYWCSQCGAISIDIVDPKTNDVLRGKLRSPSRNKS